MPDVAKITSAPLKTRMKSLEKLMKQTTDRGSRRELARQLRTLRFQSRRTEPIGRFI